MKQELANFSEPILNNKTDCLVQFGPEMVTSSLHMEGQGLILKCSQR